MVGAGVGACGHARLLLVLIGLDGLLLLLLLLLPLVVSPSSRLACTGFTITSPEKKVSFAQNC